MGATSGWGGLLVAGAGFTTPLNIGGFGRYYFSTSVDVGPVTMLPRGNSMNVEIIISLLGTYGAQKVFYAPPDGVAGKYYGTHKLIFRTDGFPLGPCTLAISCMISILYVPNANSLPYGEIEVTYRDFTEMTPW